jgi:hypothetical protein
MRKHETASFIVQFSAVVIDLDQPQGRKTKTEQGQQQLTQMRINLA